VPEQHDERDGCHDCAGDGQELARAHLVRGGFLLFVLIFLHLLRLGRDGVHGGDILRRLVDGLAVQVLDGEIEVDLGILAELFKVREHLVGRGIALVDIGRHRLHADELERLGHVGVDLTRRERHGG